MLKDKKSTKIILLAIAIILMFVPGIRIFHMRGGLMRDKNLDKVEVHYDKVEMLQAKTESGDLRIIYDESIQGICINAEHGSSNVGRNNSNLTVSTTSDDLEIKYGPDSIDEIRASSISGDIIVNGSNLDTLDLSNTSGEIKVADSLVHSALSVSTTSSDIAISKTTTEDFYASVKSGELNISSSDAESIVITSISGGINILDTEAEEMRISSTSGSTKIEASDDYFIAYNTVSGKIRANGRTMKGQGTYGNEESPLSIKFGSTSGNLEII